MEVTVKPVLAFDLSGGLIRDIAGYNLTAAVLPLNGKLSNAQSAFPDLFRRLTGKTETLAESDFWVALAKAAAIPDSVEELKKGFLTGFQFFPTSLDLLSWLQRMEVRTYVWTNMPNSWMDALHQQLGLEDLVTAYVNGQNISRRKPEPEFFHYALYNHGLDAEQVIYISERPENIVAAKPFTSQQWPLLPNDRIIQLVRQMIRINEPPVILEGGIISDL